MTDPVTNRKNVRTARRRQRYAARSVLWRESHLKRVRACGLHAAGTANDPLARKQRRIDPMVSVMVTRDSKGQGSAGFSGVQSCGSTWSCPVCAEKIQASRQATVVDALEVARRRGLTVGFLTFTVRHSRSMSLDQVWGAVSGAWRATTSGDRIAWEIDRNDYGIVGYLRLVEVTHGVNGWHVHVHALVFLDRNAAAGGWGKASPYAAVQELGASMGARWRNSLTGGFKPSKAHGFDARLVTSAKSLPDYFTKNLYAVKSTGSTAHDVTGSHDKTVKGGNVTPFGILARIVNAPERLDQATGELTPKPSRRDLDLWHEWERVSKGKRQLLWSNGMKAELGLDEDLTDQEIVEQSMGGRCRVTITPKAYRRLARRGLLPSVLDAAERDDNDQALYEILRRNEIPWELPPPDLLVA